MGLLTAALTPAAHGLGGGGGPAGPVLLQLLVTAAVAGFAAATLSRAHDVRVLAAVLTVGQLAGHALLAAQPHDHGHGDALAVSAMVVAHVAAIAVGAALISVGDRLGHALSRAVRAVTRLTCRPATKPPAAALPASHHPRHATLMVASSMPHRGPPALAAR